MDVQALALVAKVEEMPNVGAGSASQDQVAVAAVSEQLIKPVQAVREDEATYQQAGVTAVPAFVVNNRYLISGAQEPESLIESFRDIASESGNAS